MSKKIVKNKSVKIVKETKTKKGFVRLDTSNEIHNCPEVIKGKGKLKRTLYQNPYTKNINKLDMLDLNKGIGKRDDSLNTFLYSQFSQGIDRKSLEQKLLSWINPDNKYDTKPSVLINKSRYRLKMSGVTVLENNGVFSIKLNSKI